MEWPILWVSGWRVRDKWLAVAAFVGFVVMIGWGWFVGPVWLLVAGLVLFMVGFGGVGSLLERRYVKRLGRVGVHTRAVVGYLDVRGEEDVAVFNYEVHGSVRHGEVPVDRWKERRPQPGDAYSVVYDPEHPEVIGWLERSPTVGGND